jgi:hypothetical protein
MSAKSNESIRSIKLYNEEFWKLDRCRENDTKNSLYTCLRSQSLYGRSHNRVFNFLNYLKWKLILDSNHLNQDHLLCKLF